MYSTKVIEGVTHVWSIMDNAWVTLEYWEYINGRERKGTKRHDHGKDER